MKVLLLLKKDGCMRFLSRFVKFLTILSVLLIGLYIIMPMTSEAASTSMTFTPVADAYVYSDKPDANQGSYATLRVDGSQHPRPGLSTR